MPHPKSRPSSIIPWIGDPDIATGTFLLLLVCLATILSSCHHIPT